MMATLDKGAHILIYICYRCVLLYINVLPDNIVRYI